MKFACLILCSFLMACTSEPQSSEALPIDDYEYIAGKATHYAETLQNRPLDLLPTSVADFCPTSCLERSLETASLDMAEALRVAQLKDLVFEPQHIKYYNDEQIEILLHGIDRQKNQAIALLLNLRFIKGDWRLDMSHYLDR